MNPTDQFASDEAQRDPATAGNDSPDDPSAIEGVNQSRGEEEVEDLRAQGTGPHRIRSTGTENKPIRAVSAEGVEHNTQRLKKKEPDDNLPDQLDRNK